ncbi:MAG TPA: metal-dependent transcriptional regulator [Caldithrix abyssi]|uniref:Transcriptional regulator MntR n=1 Tax=Caldithrix abyssi TaxID=187145 RepID=A0A7V4WVL9_CALAY|nr:metal-dependent transcriptional regulator [Caldithrix abyssi]
MKEVWKKFEEVELTHSSVHHLMAMYELLNKNGYVRGVDVARYLNISRSSVSITVKKLITRGYVVEDENKFYHLTDHAIELIRGVLSKRRIIRLFFKEVLCLSDELAEAEACKVEHLLEEETGHKLVTFMGYYLSDAAASKKFRKDLQNFTYECDQRDDCRVCDLECYFAGKEENQN